MYDSYLNDKVEHFAEGEEKGGVGAHIPLYLVYTEGEEGGLVLIPLKEGASVFVGLDPSPRGPRTIDGWCSESRQEVRFVMKLKVILLTLLVAVAALAHADGSTQKQSLAATVEAGREGETYFPVGRGCWAMETLRHFFEKQGKAHQRVRKAVQ